MAISPELAAQLAALTPGEVRDVLQDLQTKTFPYNLVARGYLKQTGSSVDSSTSQITLNEGCMYMGCRPDGTRTDRVQIFVQSQAVSSSTLTALAHWALTVATAMEGDSLEATDAAFNAAFGGYR